MNRDINFDDNQLRHSDRNVPGFSPSSGRKLRFGVFELDLTNRELRNRGLRVKLQRKPFQVLELLLENPGALVTRSQLARHLWPNLHVNFEHGLNTAVNCLRQVLHDSSRTSHFIETLPGLGYRFIGHVEAMDETNVARAPNAPRSEAYQDYLKGRYIFGKLTEEDLRKSVAHFQAAIVQDPGCSVAYTGLADAYILFALLGMLEPAEAARRVRECLGTALELDGRLAEAHTSLATAKTIFDRDWSGAEREYLRAIAFDPNYAEARRSYANFLAAMARPQEAIEQIRRAQELDPLSLLINTSFAWSLYVSRDYAGAVNQSWKTLTLEPRFAAAQHILGLAYEQLDMHEEAIVEFRNARVCSGEHPMMIAGTGHAYANAGNHAEASHALRELDQISTRRYVPPYWQSLIYVALGAADLAIESLQSAFERRDVWLLWLKVDPRLDPLRRDRRFDNLLRDVF